MANNPNNSSGSGRQKNGLAITRQISDEIATGESSERTREKKRDQLIRSLQETVTEEHSSLDLTPEEIGKIRVRLTNFSTGACAAIPLTCPGQRCPFGSKCPFLAIGKVVVGSSCLLEINLLNEWRRKYIIEYDIDPDSMTELTLVNELAEVELLLWRLNVGLSKPENAELVQDETVGITREGTVLTKRTVSAIMQAKETLMNRRAKVIKLMVGDREGQYKREAALKIRNAQDPSQSSAKARRELQQIIAEAKKAQLPGKILEKEVPKEMEEEETPPLTPDDLISSEFSDDGLDE